MRTISISIFARANTNDNQYIFLSSNSIDQIKGINLIYGFQTLDIDYHIQTSQSFGALIFSMNEPENDNNILKSGQNVEITDNNNIIFQGIILSITYKIDNKGSFCLTTLAPSIYQLCKLPMIFSNEQAQQLSNLLKIKVEAFLLSNVVQKTNSQSFINYIINGTDITNIFNHVLLAYDLPKEIYIMAQAGQSRDSVLRSSIDYTNTVFYQREDGTPIIRQLSDKIVAPFCINLNPKDTQYNINNILDNSLICPDILSYEHTDNALSVPSIINNYAIVPPSTSIASKVPINNYISFKPNPQYYPRVQELQNAGWFSGILGHTPINTNIQSDTSLNAIRDKYNVQSDKYMISDYHTLKNKDISSYQTLLTAKEMGQSLISYANLECTISLDDPQLQNINTQFLLGTVVNINNSNMKSGLISNYHRSYSIHGAYISMCIIPVGSITGYWK